MKYTLIGTEIAFVIGVVLLAWNYAIRTFDYLSMFLIALFLVAIIMLQDINSRKEWEEEV